MKKTDTLKLHQFLLPIVTVGLISLLGCESKVVQTSREALSTIYVASNKADGNTVVGFRSLANGKFKQLGEFPTGGEGTGDLEIPALQKDETHPLANGDDPLISANGIVATDDGRHVLVVNAGDSTISLLRVNKDGSLTQKNTVEAGDKFPVSIASHGQHVVVASVGVDNGNGSISAYIINTDNRLTLVPGSRRDLKARPSTTSFSHDGKHLIVNELVTGKIKIFRMLDNSLSAEPISTINSPRTAKRFQAIPVGFDTGVSDSGDLIFMSEARFLTPEFGLREQANVVPQTPKYSWQTGSLSSYTLDGQGNISLVSADVLTGNSVEGGEIANCWVALSPDQKTLWAANALSSSISSFDISNDGSVRLKNATAYKSKPEMLFFSDLDTSHDGKELYQLVGNMGQVMIFDIQNNGDLTVKQTLSGLPKLGAYGLLVL
ncbi:lactonase family protein [Shewanella woodyi]|uniref:3-carboxymuconate cyclase n=1 Tax=Shewanella woodyi (strain ATCC 51908 / MS32) TaxID=392500 RepID=B1KQ27_SHEWM|nr:beta-propeller fold lactonase family protein [Shewanella woodyi]ACA89140.1 hypothetical protein Swoo_4891 [Shewanella woodyi ATCC 51908]